MNSRVAFSARMLLGISLAALVLADPVKSHTSCHDSSVTVTATTTVTVSAAVSTTSSSLLTTAAPGTPVSPKILIIANEFEFGYLEAYNFTTLYTGALFEQVFACTADGTICKLECGQELVSASQITSLLLIPGVDLTKSYIIITGTGGVNPKYGTAGGAAISTFSIQWEWGDMFLGADLPVNFSGQYFSSYAQDAPYKYPVTVGTEVYKLNEALVDRFYKVGSTVAYQDVPPFLQDLRATYEYDMAKQAPFLARCDTVSSQIYWHGSVAGENVEYYSNVITTGQARPCNTNEDDQGRLLALFLGAVYKRIDFGRVAMIKAFSNFDRPPPQLTAYQSRFFVGEAATEPGLRNSWKTIEAVVDDVLENWETIFETGIKPNTYMGDLFGTLGGKCDFSLPASAAPGSVQGS
ncbi:purine nucleoside permease-domain-containing protein [Talaromyces proteolyticus]|uniref:Purine nucleoside permease-domain-containing protein n=1 Tax=Talaromyces proteolyticus TaxID=1131652 RepID=A0AAD4PST4_9EURO|nr:purine nucleoside permease-domain-containing protein [Talaromyces proteolyticus]KAH8692006.1 purine nucleoside permease-domain-containing protein [Talaromyces proteolyticus]